MKPTEIGRAYDTIAETWSDDHFDGSNGVSMHERALAFRDAGGRALNVGCGASTRLSRLLRTHGYQVDGIDVSAQMLALAREADPETRYYHADVLDWEPDTRFGFISAWDCLWHVELSRQAAVMTRLLGWLATDGVLVFTAGGLPGASEHHNELMGPRMYYSTLGIPHLLALIDQCGALCRHAEFDQWPESHFCVIAQRCD